jgi:hypothetical protein
MTDIWIDPAELDAMATVISQQGQRAQEAFAADLGLRDVDLPAHLGWIRAEGAALAQEAAVVTLAYLLNAIDIGVRAQAVRSGEAVPTDVEAPTEVQAEGFVLSGSPTVSPVPSTGDQGGFVLSGTPQLDPSAAAVLAASPGAGGFVLNLIQAPNGQTIFGSGFTPSLSGLGGGPTGQGVFDVNDAIRSTLNDGIRFRNGQPLDDNGTPRSSSAIYRDRDTGKLEIDP